MAIHEYYTHLYWPQIAMKTAIHEQPAHWFWHSLALKFSLFSPKRRFTSTSNLLTFTDPKLRWKPQFTSNLRTGFGTDWRSTSLISAQYCDSRVKLYVKTRSKVSRRASFWAEMREFERQSVPKPVRRLFMNCSFHRNLGSVKVRKLLVNRHFGLKWENLSANLCQNQCAGCSWIAVFNAIWDQ